jgi:radical SAM protein with 4Fe4S-binding SPASM domain
LNGEPFIYKKLPRILKVLNDRKVASMISTNGILMSDKNINVILDNNLDLIKVHVSGFTNHIHQIQHRVGNVDVIKRNLSLLQQRIVERSSKLIVVVDYILYNHNEHEVAQFRDFTEKLGFRFSVRPGNPLGMEDTEAKQPETPAQHIPCDWLWKALTVNWNGDMLPCCDYVVWGGAKGYGRYERQTNKVRDIWNGSVIREMRRLHRSVGRSAIPICSDCNRQGIEYKF